MDSKATTISQVGLGALKLEKLHGIMERMSKLLRCPICEEIPQLPNKMLQVVQCGHRVCSVCFNNRNCNMCGAIGNAKEANVNNLCAGLRDLKVMFEYREPLKEVNVDLHDNNLRDFPSTELHFTNDSQGSVDLLIDPAPVPPLSENVNPNLPAESTDLNDTSIIEATQPFAAPTAPPSKLARKSKSMSAKKRKATIESDPSQGPASSSNSKSMPSTSTNSPTRKAPPPKENTFKFKQPSAVPPSTSSKRVLPTLSQKQLSKKNRKGESPLHAACAKYDFVYAKHCLEQGAEPNTQDHNGWTPLHEVASHPEGADITAMLLEKGANPNVPGGEDNQTPLHEAALAGCVETCRLLVSKGASKAARDAQGKIPIDVALNEETRNVLETTDSDLTDTEQLETTVLLNASTVPDRFVIFCHKLSEEQLQFVKDAIPRLNFVTKEVLNEETTHVILNLDAEKKSCEADSVYAKALLTGKWILDFEWLNQSFKEKRFVEEMDYIAHGSHDCRTNAPEKAQENYSCRQPRLFDGFHVYLKGRFSDPYSKTELTGLLKTGGAIVLSREPDPEYIPRKEQRVPYHAKRKSSMEKCSHLIIFQEGRDEPQLQYNMNHVKSLPAVWLMECIKNFAIVEPFK